MTPRFPLAGKNAEVDIRATPNKKSDPLQRGAGHFHDGLLRYRLDVVIEGSFFILRSII